MSSYKTSPSARRQIHLVKGPMETDKSWYYVCFLRRKNQIRKKNIKYSEENVDAPGIPLLNFEGSLGSQVLRSHDPGVLVQPLNYADSVKSN